MPNLIFDSLKPATPNRFVMNGNPGLSSLSVLDGEGIVRETIRFPWQVNKHDPAAIQYVNTWNPSQKLLIPVAIAAVDGGGNTFLEVTQAALATALGYAPSPGDFAGDVVIFEPNPPGTANPSTETIDSTGIQPFGPNWRITYNAALAFNPTVGEDVTLSFSKTGRAVIEGTQLVDEHIYFNNADQAEICRFADLVGIDFVFQVRRGGFLSAVTTYNIAAFATAINLVTLIDAAIDAAIVLAGGVAGAAGDYCWLSDRESGGAPITGTNGRMRISSGPIDPPNALYDTDYIIILDGTHKWFLNYLGFYAGQMARTILPTSDFAIGPGSYEAGLEAVVPADSNFHAVKNRPLLNLWSEINNLRDLVLNGFQGIHPEIDTRAQYGFAGVKRFQNDIQLAYSCILKTETRDPAINSFVTETVPLWQMATVQPLGTYVPDSPQWFMRTTPGSWIAPHTMHGHFGVNNQEANLNFTLASARSVGDGWAFTIDGANAICNLYHYLGEIVHLGALVPNSVGANNPYNIAASIGMAFIQHNGNECIVQVPATTSTLSATSNESFHVDLVEGAVFPGATNRRFAVVNNGAIVESDAITAGAGIFSHAEGSGTSALGAQSHAEGSGTTATGNLSHAEGDSTASNGVASHAEGDGTTAISNSSHAEGHLTVAGVAAAVGKYAHAEGDSTQALGEASHTEGVTTQAVGDQAHAEGDTTIATGIASHTEGHDSTAIGNYAHAEGDAANANAISSHAEGINTNANGVGAHAEGNGTTAGVAITGSYAHAEGNGTAALGESSHAEGSGTSATGDLSHVEGLNSVASGYVSHAENNETKAVGLNSHAEGDTTEALGVDGHSEGKVTLAAWRAAHAEGMNTVSGTASYTILSWAAIVDFRVITVVGDQTLDFPVGRKTRVYGTLSAAYEAAIWEVSIPPVFGGVDTTITFVSNGIGVPPTANGSVFGTAVARLFPGADDGGTHTEGIRTFANGQGAHAEGVDTLAPGLGAHAEGIFTLSSAASSHAEGSITTASGANSHTEGFFTTASAAGSHAEGQQTTASGINSHAEGVSTISSATGSHAEGLGFTAKGATANYAHAEGEKSLASGVGAHAEGQLTTASSAYAHAEGISTEAKTGIGAHAEGQSTIASAIAAHAEGVSTTASFIGAHAEGLGDAGKGALNEYAHSEGYKTKAEGKYSHAEGENTTTGAAAQGAHAEGQITIASGSYSHAEGSLSVASGLNAHAEGNSTLASNSSAHAEGDSTEATGLYSHAEGESTNAIGKGSHAEGLGDVGYGATADYAHSEGEKTLASLHSAHAEGYMTVAEGAESHAEGRETLAHGNNSHAEGYDTEANGLQSHAEGLTTIANGYQSHTEGRETQATAAESHAEGRETQATGLRSHSEGYQTNAMGSSSHSEGYQSTAGEDYSHAEGRNALTRHEASHASSFNLFQAADIRGVSQHERLVCSVRHTGNVGTSAIMLPIINIPNGYVYNFRIYVSILEATISGGGDDEFNGRYWTYEARGTTINHGGGADIPIHVPANLVVAAVACTDTQVTVNVVATGGGADTFQIEITKEAGHTGGTKPLRCTATVFLTEVGCITSV
jgi:hypothetical protein